MCSLEWGLLSNRPLIVLLQQNLISTQNGEEGRPEEEMKQDESMPFLVENSLLNSIILSWGPGVRLCWHGENV
jgi:hypothetical protein